MTVEYGRAFRNFVQCWGSKKDALRGGIIDIHEGSSPAVDAAATGSRLVRCTISSGVWTPEVLSMGTITLTGVAGTCTAITVDGITIFSGTVTFATDLTTTAALLAAAINAYWSSPRYFAYSSGAVVYVQAMPGTGTGPNGNALVSTTGGGLTGTDVNLGTGATGVASVNGIDFGAPSNGEISKVGVISGVVLVSGTAGYWRISGSRNDTGAADASPWALIRIQGTCGISGSDYNMNNTALVVGATHTIDGLDEELEI